ncbi:hypothetical protein Mame_04919 (plasmid) [Martelella mediterranea DSM 17316]|uniref:Uncharacterized protein n=1 Tax=Martelella mediterranea DSM 17316 TaxID=1122214 RepID=A0A1U9Z926_9HYPH|nr:hypothetical protein Mame_04919 [Martelella mediterranea DSM 17316]
MADLEAVHLLHQDWLHYSMNHQLDRRLSDSSTGQYPRLASTEFYN